MGVEEGWWPGADLAMVEVRAELDTGKVFGSGRFSQSLHERRVF